MERLRTLFEMMTDFRTLPAYQLERRADIFFALYLEELLKHCGYFDKDEKVLIVPEFPIKKAGCNRSYRADYMVCSTRKAVYAELKTDNRSICRRQVQYLSDAVRTPMRDVARNIAELYAASALHSKYGALIHRLEGWFLYESETHFRNSRTHRILTDISPNYAHLDRITERTVVYILPDRRNDDILHKHGFETIVFEQIIDLLHDESRHGDDPTARIFAEALAKWITPPI